MNENNKKYKVGDKVVVKSKISEITTPTNGIYAGFNGDMFDYLGSTVTIKKVKSYCYQIKEDGGYFNWQDCMFKGLAPKSEDFLLLDGWVWGTATGRGAKVNVRIDKYETGKPILFKDDGGEWQEGILVGFTTDGRAIIPDYDHAFNLKCKGVECAVGFYKEYKPAPWKLKHNQRDSKGRFAKPPKIATFVYKKDYLGKTEQKTIKVEKESEDYIEGTYLDCDEYRCFRKDRIVGAITLKNWK